MRTILSALVVLSSTFIAFADGWPQLAPKPEWAEELNARFAGPSGMFHDPSYTEYLAPYRHDGDYLNWGAIRKFRSDGEVVLTDDGLPQVIQDGKPYWNAVTLSHFALTMHGRLIGGDEAAALMMWRAVDKLVELQREDGGFPYPSRPHRAYVFPDGWVSAMAQGNALSAFVRALSVEDRPDVRRAAELSFQNLTTPVGAGGTRASMADFALSLGGYTFLPEYPSKPIYYTLNGYMFALLGVYDWAKFSDDERAAQLFENGMTTLERILPYYDIDGFSTYDLAHWMDATVWPKVAPEYEGIHVYLLHALGSLTKSPVLAEYETKWAAKIDAMNAALRLTKMDVQPAAPRVGESITVSLDARGGDGTEKLFRLSVKHGGEWTDVSGFSTSATIEWTPPAPGEYVLGFFAKNAGSSADYDNFRYRSITVD